MIKVLRRIVYNHPIQVDFVIWHVYTQLLLLALNKQTQNVRKMYFFKFPIQDSPFVRQSVKCPYYCRSEL